MEKHTTKTQQPFGRKQYEQYNIFYWVCCFLLGGTEKNQLEYFGQRVVREVEY